MYKIYICMTNSRLPLLLFCLSLFMFSCKKKEYVGKDPYANAKAPLQVKLNTVSASPASGTAGTTVTFTGNGFDKYKDSGMVVKFNDVQAEIIQVSESSLQVKVPDLASSGLVTLTVLHQVFPGPLFRVKGIISIDSLFHSVPGTADGSINDIIFVPGGQYLIGGDFDDFDNSGLKDGYHGVARINPDGSIDHSFKIGKGVSGSVNSMIVQTDGKYVLGGNINNYGDRFKPGYISNILRINTDGSLDSVIVSTKAGNSDTLPSLNAYFGGRVTKILQTPDSGKLVVIGSFNYYMSKDFTISTLDGLRDSVKVDSIRMEGIVRLNEDGTFDSSFNYDATTHSSFSGANGSVRDAFIQSDGKVIIVGDFTKYHDKTANRIARLNNDGSLDNTFNPASGPDDRVFSVSLLSNGKYLISGQFLHINGKESRKVAILNADGTLDNSFNVGTGPTAGPDGNVYKATQLKNGKIFIAGSFDRFSNVKRGGTVILNADGTLSNQFNNLGAIEGSGGSISKILNVPNANATILVGGFTKYDLQTVNGIVLLRY